MKQLTAMLASLLLFMYTNAQVGGLDPSFKNPDGFVINPQSAGDDYGNSMIVQNDGKILVAVVVPEQYFKVLRYKLDGSLDGGFGTGGVVTIRQGATSTAQSYAVALQSNGKIIVGGYTWSAVNNDFALVRLNTDGSVDGSFGTNGWVYTNMKGVTTADGNDQIRKLVVLPDNSIIAAGFAHNTQDKDMAIAKYDADGALVTGFGVNGKIVLDVNNDDVVTGLAVTSTGKIVVVGNTNDNGTDKDITLAQYTSAGTLDPGFNGGNIRRLGTGSAGNYEAHGVAVQSDNKIVITGLMPAPSSSKNIYVARILQDGSFDPDFNGGAELSINYASGISNEEGRTVMVQANGKIIITGYTDATSSPSHYDLLLVRLNTDGSPDTNFDTDGKATTGISTSLTSDFTVASALSGQRIYITGSTDYSGTSTMDFFVAAFVNDFTTLPIVLSDFVAQKLTTAVNLKWQTSSEENVKRFVIERSTDGKTYKAIGQVAAVGNSSTKQSYNFVDNSPFMPSTNFYRLLMQDADGGSKYSKILTVKFSSELSANMQVSPNPTSGNLQVQLPDGLKGIINLQVFDLNGRIVKTQNLSSDGNALSTSIDVNGLPNGLYILKAQSGSTSLTSRFIKK
ncbi:T9SS type A sorting domain-containing protein [Niastella sp. OAS944]|uniref:T9SS type A sorting domain-containing protein n=1 Tax=Niastella sp. OAS944 TaxID=2664089 RepID=UPI0034889B21|nr:putative delta-60 repeat protein [Chitinophagaceae bacterium OAS944]